MNKTFMSSSNKQLYINKAEINSMSHIHYYKLGESCLKQGDLDNALIFYKRSIENNKFSFSYASLGKVFEAKNRLDEAIEMYQTAIHLNPHFYGFHYDLAKVFIKKNSINKAMTELNRCIEKNLQHHPSYKLLGNLLKKQGEHQKLNILYQQDLLANKHSPTSYEAVLQDALYLDIDCFNDIFWNNLQIIRDFWVKHEPSKKVNKWILVDACYNSKIFGGCTIPGLILAKILQKFYGYRIAAIVKPRFEAEVKQVLVSFGVEKIIKNPHTRMVDAQELTKNQQDQINNFIKNANSENFKILMKDFRCEDIQIGDLMYDMLLRQKGISTPIFNQEIVEKLKEGCQRYNIWNEFLSGHNVKAIISSHATVYNFGLINRLAATKNINVFFRTRQVCRKYNSFDELYKFYTYIPEKLFLYFWNHHKEKAISIGKQLLENQIGIKHQSKKKLYPAAAFSKDKKIYTHEEICQKLNLETSFPIVVVASHAFNDVPHGHHDRLFVDYYEWLVETLKICYNIPCVNWIVKEHPEVGKKYKVDRTAEKLVTTEYSTCQHIKFSPQDMSNLSLPNFTHAIVTVSGTIAHEMACLGIPSVLAGSSDYSECGFTYNPKSVNEYQTLLNSIHNLGELSQEEIEKAYVAYAIRFHYKRVEASFPLEGDLFSLIECWSHQIKNNKINIEGGLFIQNFMIQILSNQQDLLRFDEILPS